MGRSLQRPLVRGFLALVLLVLLALGALAVGPGLRQAGVSTGPVAPGIPTPIVDGGFHYYGDGRFVTDAGREFSWRNGRFENQNGSLLEVPESVNETMRARGLPTIDTQPTVDQ
ncbi:MAG: hypothetical protein ACYCX3_14530 [Thermoleophilia bacterium]